MVIIVLYDLVQTTIQAGSYVMALATLPTIFYSSVALLSRYLNHTLMRFALIYFGLYLIAIVAFNYLLLKNPFCSITIPYITYFNDVN